MRTIKFKAKRVSDNKWVYGHLMYKYDELNAYYVIGESVEEYSSRVYPKTICQFTGLQDQNGKDIYEGDNILYLGAKGVVYYDNDICMFMAGFETNRSSWSFDSMDELIEIIGNIHD